MRNRRLPSLLKVLALIIVLIGFLAWYLIFVTGGLAEYKVIRIADSPNSCTAVGPECEAVSIILANRLGIHKEYEFYGDVVSPRGESLTIWILRPGDLVTIEVQTLENDREYITSITLP